MDLQKVNHRMGVGGDREGKGDLTLPSCSSDHITSKWQQVWNSVTLVLLNLNRVGTLPEILDKNLKH